MNDIFTLISMIASVASIVLAILAIWLALYGKSEADKTNKKTQDLLIDIRSDAKTISQVAMPELKAYGDSVRRYIFDSDGMKPVLNESEIEESVNSSMNEIRNELKELKGLNDLSNLTNRLNSIENQIDISANTIKKSIVLSSEVENKGKIIIYARNFEYEFKVSRSQWDEVIKRLLNDLNLDESSYGDWLLINDRTAVPATKELVFDSSIPMKAVFVGGINYILKPKKISEIAEKIVQRCIEWTLIIERNLVKLMFDPSKNY